MSMREDVEGGQVFVLDKNEHRLLGWPREGAHLASRRELSDPPQLQELGDELPLSAAAAKACTTASEAEAYAYEVAGARYWAYCDLSESPGLPGLWIGVVVPDARFSSERAWLPSRG